MPNKGKTEEEIKEAKVEEKKVDMPKPEEEVKTEKKKVEELKPEDAEEEVKEESKKANVPQSEETEEEAEKEKIRRKKEEEQKFEEELAEKAFGDKKRAGQMQCYTFYFNQDKWKISRLLWRNQMSVKDARQENKEAASQGELDLQAAKEGRLFIVSNKAPYLRKVNVDENGRVSLEVVTKNPIKVPEGLEGQEKRAWENLQTNFEDLVKGNTAEAHWWPRRGWRNYWAKSKVNDIINGAENANKKEMQRLEQEQKEREKLEKAMQSSKVVKLDEPVQKAMPEEAMQEKEAKADSKEEDVKEQAEEIQVEIPEENVQKEEKKADVKEEASEKKEEDVREETPKEKASEKKENVQEQEQSKAVFAQAMGLVNVANYTEAAAVVAQAMQNLSKNFNEAKRMDDDTIYNGMQMRELMEKVKKSGFTELLTALENTPEFKENKELYQAQENLAEIGQLGKDARKQIESQLMQDTPVEKKVLLDLLAGEYASSLLIRKNLGQDVSEEMKKISQQPNAEKFIQGLENSMENTGIVEELMGQNPRDLQQMFSDGITSQKEYKKAFTEAKEIHQKQKNAEKELQKENKKESEKKKENEVPVMSNQDKRKSGPTI